jgi:molybdate transport system substrate-binding protein
VRRFVVSAVVAAVALSACSDSAGQGIYVSTAASLTDAFGEIEVAFESANPDVDVVLNIAGSSTLREQMLEGAPIDVFASANPANMEAVAGLLARPAETFARNRLQLAVPAANPGGVAGLVDLAREDLLVGLCAPQVPCGSLARVILEAAQVTPVVDTNEFDVRSLLVKLEEASLDVGMVYATDVAATADVIGFDIPEEFDRTVEYPIGVLAASGQRAAADRFVAFVLSAEGQDILSRYAFESP